MSYDIGDQARLTATFTTLAGTPTNPTAVVLKIRTPGGVESTPAAVSDGAGVYHYDLALTEAGRWSYRFVGTGTVAAAVEGDVLVDSSRFNSP